MKNDEIIDDGLQSEIGENPEVSRNDNPVNNPQETKSSSKKGSESKFIIFLKTLLLIVASIILIISSILFILYAVPVLSNATSGHKIRITGNQKVKQSAEYKKQISFLAKEIQRLSRKYNGYTSGQSYVVINTTDNRFFLYKNKNLIREGFCSSGSYTLLQSANHKQWIFKTPKGKYWIHGKTTNPVWKKPDWAFVEEGLPIPPKDDFSRYEYGVLGDYALALGDGYLIHGTIYKRFLGMPVTHGCVRLNDEDLKVIFNTLNIGSKVYIF